MTKTPSQPSTSAGGAEEVVNSDEGDQQIRGADDAPGVCVAQSLEEATAALQNVEPATVELILDGAVLPREALDELSAHVTASKTLETLTFDMVGLGMQGTPAVGQAVAGCVKLQTLKLRFAGLGAPGAKLLLENLGTRCSLTSLDLTGNCLGSRGAGHIAKGLPCFTALSELNLCGNHAGHRGAGQLVPALLEFPILKKLGMSSNDLRLAGTTEFCHLLEHGRCALTSLDLSANEIADAGAELVASALSRNPNSKLEHLSLSDNSIHDNAIKRMAEAIQANQGLLSHLDLSANSVSDQGVSLLLPALDQNAILTHLDLSSNNITMDYAKVLEPRLAKNRRLLVLTVIIEETSEPHLDADHISLSCISMNGNCLASLETSPTEAFMSLQMRVAELANVDVPSLRLIMPDGHILTAATGEVPVSEVLFVNNMPEPTSAQT